MHGFRLLFLLLSFCLLVAASEARADDTADATLDAAFGSAEKAPSPESPAFEPAPAPNLESLVIPPYPGTTPAGAQLDMSTRYASVDDPAAILDWYNKTLPLRGWSITGKVLLGDLGYLLLSRPGVRLKLTARKESGQSGSSYSLNVQP